MRSIITKMKNKIAFGMTACGMLIFLVGAAGVEAKGQAGYIALGIAAIGLAIAGAGVILNKLKERETCDNHTLSH